MTARNRVLVGEVGHLALKANLHPSANFCERNASNSDGAPASSCKREILTFFPTQYFHPALDALMKQTGFHVSQLNMFVIKASCRPRSSHRGCNRVCCCGLAAAGKLRADGRGPLRFPSHSSLPLCWLLAHCWVCGTWALLACEAGGLFLGRHLIPKAMGSALPRTHPDWHVFGPSQPLPWGLNRVFYGRERGARVRGVSGRSRGPPSLFSHGDTPQTTPISTLFIAESQAGTQAPRSCKSATETLFT